MVNAIYSYPVQSASCILQAKFGPVVAANVSKVSKLSQMNQLLRRGKRKGWAEYSPQHFKSLRKMIVDMVSGWMGQGEMSQAVIRQRPHTEPRVEGCSCLA
jgi:hypothetical protein